uniref:Vomeronasal type-1 receptor n=1 Tax=Panagrolaimus sp. PS1159 TaxID=55785 RepID=A0AC35FS37_9BILA
MEIYYILICLFQGWRSRGSGVNIPFAKICFITGICDILTLVSNNIFNISPKACLFPEFFKSFEDLFVHIYLFFAWGGGASEGLCVLVIAFNRLSTVISPELSKKISQRSCNRILYRQIIRESRLLTISSIICAVQIIYVGYIALREFTGFDRSYIGASIMGDICAGINPYLLLIFSPIIRKRAFKFLNCKSKVFIKIVKVHTLNLNPNEC